MSAEDFDNDLMADAWERAHGLDFATADGGADTDCDGYSNRDEFHWDTDPLVPASCPRFTSFERVDKQWRLRLPVSTQRRYVLQKSTDLQSWTDTGPPVVPVGTELEFVYQEAAGSRRSYRVRVDFQFPLHQRLRGAPCKPFNSDTKVRIKLATQVRYY